EVASATARQATGAAALLAVDGDIAGFESYTEALAEHDGSDIDDPSIGGTMLYTSGTTGRPKGVNRDRATAARASAGNAGMAGYKAGESVHLCTGPLYHAAPLAFSLNIPLLGGAGVVMMDGWDAEETLRLIETYRITHTHMVPTMFHRML